MRHAVLSEDSVRVDVRAILMDPVSQMPVVILQPPNGSGYLPIWIGVCEANAIALEMEGVATPRPMTHDLIRSLIDATGFRVDHILIHSLSDSIFLASIRLSDGGHDLTEVDSRPSDAIAVALRTSAPVYVAEGVLRQAGVSETSEEEAIRLILERLSPEDLGGYEM